MCHSYFIEDSQPLKPYVRSAEQSPLTERMVHALGCPFTGFGTAKPGDIVPAIASLPSGTLSVFPMRWGQKVAGAAAPVDSVYSEAASMSQVFGDSWKRRRCILPASYYFDSDHLRHADGTVTRGDRYAVQPAGEDTAWLAGIYSIEEFRGLKYPAFSILTRPASPSLQILHERMPLLLPPSLIGPWISPDSHPDLLVPMAVTDVFVEKSCVVAFRSA